MIGNTKDNECRFRQLMEIFEEAFRLYDDYLCTLCMNRKEYFYNHPSELYNLLSLDERENLTRLKFAFEDRRFELEAFHSKEQPPKYRLTDETMKYDGHTLHRIECVKPFALPDGTEIHHTEKGGWIESERNLSQKGSSWITCKAKAYENARVLDDSLILDIAVIGGTAVIRNEARIGGHSAVCGNAVIGDKALVDGETEVTGRAVISDDSRITGRARIGDNARITRGAVITDDVTVSGSVHGKVLLSGTTTVRDGARILISQDGDSPLEISGKIITGDYRYSDFLNNENMSSESDDNEIELKYPDRI